MKREDERVTPPSADGRVEQATAGSTPKKRRVEFPIIRSEGRMPFQLTNEQLYELIEFP